MSETANPKKSSVIDPATVETRRGSSYPADLAHLAAGRSKQSLGDVAGLTDFGVNLVRLAPGSWSSIRHWHSREDEFIYIIEGEAVLVTDAGEQTLRPGMAAGFPAGTADGHHLINRTTEPALYLEIGDRTPGDEVHYPDVDLFLASDFTFRHKTGEPY